MTGLSSLRARLPELALEAVMVVFAVLVALAFEEWSDERQMEEFADRVQMAVIAEMRANLEELSQTGPELHAQEATLAEVLQREDVSLLKGDLGLDLPDFSSAAWRASQASPAAAYLDYGWVIDASRVYELYEIYSRIVEQIIDEFSGLGRRGPTFESLSAIYGRLEILTDLHGVLQERIEALLESEATDETGG